PVLLVLLAVGVAIIPSAVVRAVQPTLEGTRRQALAFGAGVPLLAIAAALGGTFAVEDPGTAPAQLATDLTDSLPPGPGVLVATRPTTFFAVQYANMVAGARPDLTLVPPMRTSDADAIVAIGLRTDRVVGADAAAFGRLDILRAFPRGRGFQLLGEIPTAT